MTMLAASDSEHEAEMLEGQPAEVGPEELLPEAADRQDSSRCGRFGGTPAASRDEIRGDRSEVLSLELGGRVHASHRRLVDAALELRQRPPRPRQPLRQFRSIKQDGIVRGKVVTVVFKDRQAVFVDLRIRRIDVDDIDLMLRNGFIRETVVEPSRRIERQLIRSLQSGPAVRTADELLRESEPQLRMRLEVRQARDALGAGVVAA